MKILILGSGGREHALAWKIRQNPKVTALYCAPGNAGTAQLGTNVALRPEDGTALVEFAKKEGIDFTIVGPDDALAAGVVDVFEAAGLRIFGPRAEAAQLESSKIFAKEFMRRHGIPTAESREFDRSDEALKYCESLKFPVVVKADGLALGKGVIIAPDLATAQAAIRSSMDEGQFGEAGKRVVIEEFLTGVECSIHALIDGSSYLLFPDCRDHKRAFDGDAGPNTGGMGTISPSHSIDENLRAKIRSEVLDRFVAGLQKDGILYKGMLFPGLMITADGLKVLEFNCRFGDPETQVLVRLLESDLLELLEATVDGHLSTTSPQWSEKSATCVILASGGYPGSYAKGKPIDGLQEAEAEGAVVFHAGTAQADSAIVTNGGRVLGVTALGTDLADARKNAYAAADKISFENLQRRNDIGLSALNA